ncbi:hypothetical protein OY671_008169, partial [Metschnikowia pulcherrima]
MASLRAFLSRHRTIAAASVASASCMKASVPAGYMVAPQARTFTSLVCADSSGERTATQVSIPARDGTHQNTDANTKAHDVCPFAGHAFPASGGADPISSASAIAFVSALGFAAVPA